MSAFHFSTLFFVATLFPGVAAPAPSRAPAPPWERQPLGAAPAEIIGAAKSIAVPADADRQVLFQEGTFHFAANGAREFRYLEVSRVVTSAGVSSAARLDTSWEPWHQERPTLRARVITTDGVEHTLDPATVEEVGPPPGEDVYSDLRRLRAPLPAVAPGAIIEEEVSVRDTAPLFAGGSVETMWFGAPWPVSHARLVIDAPSALPLHWSARVLPGIKPERRVAGDRVTLVFEHGPTASIPPPPEAAPPDPIWPHVSFSTGRSWSDVAGGYARVLGAQLAKTDRAQLQRLAREALAAAPSKEPLPIAAALLALVHREVRYTGVEFGAATLVPRTPAETLQRHYGDCKDQALLLAALLETAGVKARLALVRSGAGFDVEETLPGLGRFNHAIVYVPGPAPFFIDPTHEYARAGELPIWDQGRLALVADASTKALLRTPSAPFGANREVETREFFLAERGPARIVETSRSWGSFERVLRREWSVADAKKLEENLTRYVQAEYAAKRLTRSDHSDVHDLGKPFESRLEIADAARGSADEHSAAVAIHAAWMMRKLPHALIEADESKRKRTCDYVLSEPFVYEWSYRIVPPPGFAARPLPTSDTVNIGPLRLIESFALEKSGEVSAHLRFETNRTRLTPADVEAIYADYRRLESARPIMIEFSQTGREQLDAGRVREALEQFGKLVALHPREAMHHIELARALLVAGLGSAARAEADKAIALEPASAPAWAARATTLEHDLFGRRFGAGFDFAGAEAALRKAIQLDGKNAVTRGELAILLEHDTDGVRYSPRARMADSVAEYRALVKETGSHALDENPLFDLLYLQRWRELIDSARALPSSVARDQLLVAAIAAADGPPAAVREATRLAEERRANTLQAAGEQLCKARVYPQAAALLEEAARGSDYVGALRSRVELLRRLRHHEEVPLPDSDPTSVLRKLFLVALGPGGMDLKRMRGLFAQELQQELDRDGGSFVAALRGQSERTLRRLGLSHDVLLDLISTHLQVEKEGDDRVGYRLHLTGKPPAEFPAQDWFVVREAGHYRILAGATGLTPIARRALRAVEAHDPATAGRWLDWVTQSVRAQANGQAIAESITPPQTYRAGSVERARLQAALLLAWGDADDAKLALPILRAVRAATAVVDEADVIGFVIARVLVTLQKLPDALAIVQELAVRHPGPPLDVLRFDLLARLRRYAELRRLADEQLRRVPEDAVAVRALAFAAEGEQRWDELDRLTRRLVQLGRADAYDYNRVAWAALFHPPVAEPAIDDARRAVELSQRQRPGILHTLASLYAELGRAGDARDALLEGIDQNGGQARPSDYYVLGRIAESYRMRDAAAAEYRRVTPSGEPVDLSAWTLAQRRLAAIATP